MYMSVIFLILGKKAEQSRDIIFYQNSELLLSSHSPRGKGENSKTHKCAVCVSALGLQIVRLKQMYMFLNVFSCCHKTQLGASQQRLGRSIFDGEVTLR